MTYDEIRYEVSERVATITLNRPDRLNAFTRKMMAELIDAFDQVDADDDVRAVVITGEGRGFCAGAELGDAGGDTFNAGARGRDPEAVNRDGGGQVSLRIFECTKPVIAAINGSRIEWIHAPSKIWVAWRTPTRASSASWKSATRTSR